MATLCKLTLAASEFFVFGVDSGALKFFAIGASDATARSTSKILVFGFNSGTFRCWRIMERLRSFLILSEVLFLVFLSLPHLFVHKRIYIALKAPRARRKG